MGKLAYISHPKQSPTNASPPPPNASPCTERSPGLGDGAQQLGLEDELALLVLLASLVGLVVFPAHRLLALGAVDVADNVAAGGHVALVGVGLGDVDDVVEEIGLAMLAAEVLAAAVSVGAWGREGRAGQGRAG